MTYAIFPSFHSSYVRLLVDQIQLQIGCMNHHSFCQISILHNAGKNRDKKSPGLSIAWKTPWHQLQWKLPSSWDLDPFLQTRLACDKMVWCFLLLCYCVTRLPYLQIMRVRDNRNELLLLLWVCQYAIKKFMLVTAGAVCAARFQWGEGLGLLSMSS